MNLKKIMLISSLVFNSMPSFALSPDTLLSELKGNETNGDLITTYPGSNGIEIKKTFAQVPNRGYSFILIKGGYCSIRINSPEKETHTFDADHNYGISYIFTNNAGKYIEYSIIAYSNYHQPSSLMVECLENTMRPLTIGQVEIDLNHFIEFY